MPSALTPKPCSPLYLSLGILPQRVAPNSSPEGLGPAGHMLHVQSSALRRGEISPSQNQLPSQPGDPRPLQCPLLILHLSTGAKTQERRCNCPWRQSHSKSNSDDSSAPPTASSGCPHPPPEPCEQELRGTSPAPQGATAVALSSQHPQSGAHGRHLGTDCGTTVTGLLWCLLLCESEDLMFRLSELQFPHS